MTKGHEIVNAHMDRDGAIGRWEFLADRIDQAITEARIAGANTVPKPPSPELQAALVDALRDAVPQLCLWCAQGNPQAAGVHKWYSDGRFHTARCLAQEQCALLARVDAEAPK